MHFGSRYNFSIDGHRLTVIEADGVETEPVTVDQLEIFASQRYSIIVSLDSIVSPCAAKRSFQRSKQTNPLTTTVSRSLIFDEEDIKLTQTSRSYSCYSISWQHNHCRRYGNVASAFKLIHLTFSAGVNSAILRYDGAPNVDPNHSFPNPNPVQLNEADLHVRVKSFCSQVAMLMLLNVLQPLVNPGAVRILVA